MDVLILHGIGGHAGIHWQGWLRDELDSRGYNVRMPNLSQSDHPDRQAWLDEVLTVAGDIQPANLIVVGHSLGVTTALDFVEQLASPLKALVSVSGFAVDYGADFNSYFLRERQIDFDKVRQNLQQSAVLYGDNDPYVTQAALSDLSTDLGVPPLVIPEGGHLNTESGYTQLSPVLDIILGIK